MGACYSKNTPCTTKSIESKVPKKKPNSNVRNKKYSLNDTSPEKFPLNGSKKTNQQNIKPNNTKTNSSSTFDYLNGPQQVGHNVVPSDSGIESIGTLPEEAQGSAKSGQVRDELLKSVDDGYLGSCHINGISKQNGLLSVGDTCCGPCQVDGAIDSPHCICSLHVSEVKSVTGNVIDNCNSRVVHDINNQIFVEDVSHSNVTSLWQESGSVHSRSDKNLWGPDWHAKKSITFSTAYKNKTLTVSQERGEIKAPLAHFDPLDLNPNDFLTNRICKQENSFGGKQIVTSQAPKCLLPSHEQCNTACHCAMNQIGHNTEMVQSCHCSRNQLGHDTETVQCTNTDICDQELQQPSKNCECYSHTIPLSPQDLNGENSCTFTNISCPHPKLINNEAFESPCRAPTETGTKLLQVSPSGVCKHTTPAPQFHSNRQAEVDSALGFEVSANGSKDSSLNYERIGTSLDQHRIGRLTCLSSSNNRQINESSEEMPALMTVLGPVIVDGVDFVILPQETYHQLQSDLSLLREQLLNLSSLIQEADGVEQQMTDSVQEVVN